MSRSAKGGPVATVEATVPGDYLCTFTATAPRDCPPGPLGIGPETLTPVDVDLDVDSDNDGAIGEADDAIEDATFSAQTPGEWLWINNDDSDGDGNSDDANWIWIRARQRQGQR